ncbi:MAG: CAP domain-containing protein [Polyangiaceae bacterium]
MGRARAGWVEAAAHAGGAAVALLVVAGCNLITGADDLKGTGGAATSAQGGSGPQGSTGASMSSKASSGSSSPTATGATASSSTGMGPPCGGACGANEHCEDVTMTCVCDPGFAQMNGACVAVPPGDPSVHTQAEVCAKWAEGHVVTTPAPLVTNGMDCDAGTLKQGAITDTLNRLNMFRWLNGLGPTTTDAGLNQTDQLCANMESWWDFSSGGNPHAPPSSTKCYTAQGASGAGMSNIAWGNGPAQSIDQFIEDNGNETTMGHRRWLVNPPLGPVGIGYWEGGGQYGSAECLAVFGQSGGGPSPPWVAVPNQGFVPVEIAGWTWTFHAPGANDAQISVLRVDDNTPLPITLKKLQQGFGVEAISWTKTGWQAEAGKTYRVTVTGLAGGDVTYDVKPVQCN